MVTVAGDCLVKGRLHEGICPHPQMVWGWRQNLQAVTPDTLSSLGNMEDCTTFPLTIKVVGSMTIPIAKSQILSIYSDSLMAVRSMGISTCLSDTLGGWWQDCQERARSHDVLISFQQLLYHRV